MGVFVAVAVGGGVEVGVDVGIAVGWGVNVGGGVGVAWAIMAGAGVVTASGGEVGGNSATSPLLQAPIVIINPNTKTNRLEKT